ncbi:MAG: ArnT family glycosyltransferase, partial [Caldilinea sp.]
MAIILLAFLLRTWDLDRLPPGLYFDEAYYALDAKGVVDGVARPIFFPGNYGREPIFIYLQSLALILWGASAYSLRLVAAFVGVLTIPVIWLLARAALNWDQAQRKVAPAAWIALIAAAGLAVSYLHLSLSRLGFRVILLPLFSAFTIYFFIVAWRRQRRLDFAVAGFWLGAAQYTYISSRLLVVVIGGFIVFEMLRCYISSIRQANTTSKHLFASPYVAGVGVMVAVGLLTVAPLVWTFVQHPEYVTSRVGDVSIFVPESKVAPGTPMQRLGENLVNVTTSFFFTGDLNPRHNLPGRSLNDPVLATLFAAGVLTTLIMLRKPANRLVLLWLAVMLTPTIFSLQAPHWLRMAGAMPATAVLYAIGGQTFAALVERWLAPMRTTILILLTMLIVSAPATVSAYFGQWAQLPTLAKSFDADQYEAAMWLRSELAQEGPQSVLLTRHLFRSIHMRFLNPQLPGAAPSLAETDKWFEIAAGARYLIEDDADADQPLFLLAQEPDGNLTATQLSPYDAQGVSLIADILDGKAPFNPRSTQPGHAKPLLYTGDLPTISLKLDRVQYPLNVRFVNGVELVGYSLPKGVAPCNAAGDDLPLILHFRRESGESFYDNGVLLFAHLMLPAQ